MRLFVALVTLTLGCSSQHHGGGDLARGVSDLGQASLDLAQAPQFLFSFNVAAHCGDQPAAQCGMVIVVGVTDLANNPLDDATVSVSGIALPSTGNGQYTANPTGLVSRYDLVVTRGGQTRTMTLMAEDFTFSLVPNPPTHGGPTTVSWTPANQANVHTQLIVTSSTSGGSTFGLDAGDDGQISLPASAFPSAGDYVVHLERVLQPVDQSPPLPFVRYGVYVKRTMAVTAQ